MSRENLYVIATRAREHTMLYVATHQVPGLDPDLHLDAVSIDPNAYAAREVLEHVITLETAELSATETIRQAQNDATNLSILIPNYQHAHQILTAQISDTTAPLHAVNPAELPAWLPSVPDQGSLAPREYAYLQASAELIRTRIQALTEHAVTERPAWTRKLGNEPARSEERTVWTARIGVLAAYREQYRITDDDPHQPAGPHIESTHIDYDAYLHAFRAAAELRQAARGRPWDQIDPTIPAPTPDAPAPEVSREYTQTQARERHRQTFTPAQRQRHAEAAAERRVRHARAHGQSETKHEPGATRPLLRPRTQENSHGDQPKIGW